MKFVKPIPVSLEIKSLPSRERGLKSKYVDWLKNDCDVAPFAGAWIEIALMPTIPRHVPSLPSRERGLKFTRLEHLQEGKEVAPFAGAWIEIA